QGRGGSGHLRGGPAVPPLRQAPGGLPAAPVRHAGRGDGAGAAGAGPRPQARRCSAPQGRGHERPDEGAAEEARMRGGAPAPGPERPRLLRRLIPIALVALGLVLWRSPLFPQPHTFVWDRPFGLDVVSAEVQLWRGETLLARAEWPDATTGTLTQQLTLRAGPIRVFSFVRVRDGSE